MEKLPAAVMARRRQGGLRGVEILKGQGLVGGFKIVETEGEDEGPDYLPLIGRKTAGGDNAQAADQDGEGGKGYFAHEQKNGDNPYGQKAGHLPDGLNDAVLPAVEPHHLNREVGVKGGPAEEGGGLGESENRQIAINGAGFDFFD